MAKRILVFLGIIAMFTVSAFAPAEGVTLNLGSKPPSPASIIVGYSNGMTETVSVPSGQSAEALIERYLSQPDVSYAEKDQGAQMTSLTPNDTFYKIQRKAFSAMTITEAWDISGGSSGIIVAVLDTGVDASHPDLAGRILSDGYNFVAGNADTSDDNGHGTMSAGIIAAGVDNGTGLSGATQSCSILPVKVLDAKGNGQVSKIAAGITYAADYGADVINLSLGCPESSQTLQDAVNYAYGKGVIVIAASGNSGGSIQYPAACSHALSVGAVTSASVIATYSNYGSQQGLVAVGSGIFSTSLNGGYAVGSGTSYAAPFVSSLAALLLSVDPALSPDELTAVMQNTATDLGDAGWDQYYGHGCVSFSAALQSIAPEAVTADPAQPEIQEVSMAS